MPPLDAADLAHSGQVIVCFAERCELPGGGSATGGRMVENEIVRNFLRFPGKPQRYTIFIVPPSNYTCPGRSAP